MKVQALHVVPMGVNIPASHWALTSTTRRGWGVCSLGHEGGVWLEERGSHSSVSCPAGQGGVPLLLLWAEPLLLSVFFCVSWYFWFVGFFASFKNTWQQKEKQPREHIAVVRLGFQGPS